MAKVSMRIVSEDSAPLYSLRVGTTQVDPTGETRISSHLSIYDLPDAIVLLTELGEKYRKLREQARADLATKGFQEKPSSERGGIAKRFRPGGRS